ncbi:MAG: dienelactone hydrolase family protein [Neisseriaceae bacterium]|nr:dienelactone hydrolase family protein [Neisseriaceae bacterium]MBP6861221.1 dienelactone hydrolase family protein [Neisseriaceae bacterium]
MNVTHFIPSLVRKACVALLLGLCLPAIGQPSGWQQQQYAHKAYDLPYQWYTPTQAGTEKLPLVVVLHGSYEAGTDNQQHMLKGTNIGPDYFARAKIQAIQKAYVLAPQTSVPVRWASTGIPEYDLNQTPITPSMAALLSLIDDTLKTKAVDPRRIYIVGLSRGGQGAWNAAFHRPDLFAAIVPIAGSGSPKDGAKLIKMPIWAFHGDQDEITDVAYTRHMVDAIIQAGGSTKTLRYTEIQGGDHADAWLTAYRTDELWRWLLSHQK